MTNPAAQTDPAIRSIAAAIEAAVRSAIESAAVEGERVVAYRVVQHSEGHLAVWLDLEAGPLARFAAWDGSDLTRPMVIESRRRTRDSLRALRVHTTGSLVQDWTEAT